MGNTVLATTSTDAPDTPAFSAATFGVPAYDDIEDESDLIAYSRAYIAVVIAHYDLEADAEHIAEWSITDQAKRRAAAIKHADLEELGHLTLAGLTSPDWDDVRERGNARVKRSRLPFDDVKDVEVRLTWGAFEAFDEDEWQATLRHEAVHIEQFHTYATTDHGIKFNARAEQLDTTEECKQFSDFDYPFECPECGADCGGRYRESKAVKFARLSLEEQEEWVAEGKTYWESDCCEAYLTLK